MIIAINYADSKYEKQRKYNTKTAYTKGKVDKVIEYSFSDIDEDFRKKNQVIFSYERGAGLWLWKPYFILKTLEKMKDGDYLFYCDAGAFYVNKVKYLIDVLEREGQSVMGFEQPLLEREFTKRETFELMDYHDFSRNQLLGGYVLLKKDKYSIDFIQEWLNYAEDERIISPQYFLPEITNLEDFRAHREDQSIFSILYHKHKLRAFREPTQFGDRQWQYRWLPAHAWCAPWTYHPIHHEDSDYPRILISCRKANPQITHIKELIKDFFSWCGIYNEAIYVRMNHCK